MPAYWTVGISNGNGKLIINAVANSEAHFLLVITESLCKITEIQQKRTGRDLVHEISTGFLLLENKLNIISTLCGST